MKYLCLYITPIVLIGQSVAQLKTPTTHEWAISYDILIDLSISNFLKK
jgi:hypothetical protein